MKLVWLGPAIDDLENIHDYISQRNLRAADAMERRIHKAVQILSQMPHFGRPGRVAGTRELVVGRSPYIIPYRTTSEEVQILAVIHGARQWPESF